VCPLNSSLAELANVSVVHPRDQGSAKTENIFFSDCVTYEFKSVIVLTLEQLLLIYIYTDQ
jgi:hypothetical protein